MKTTRFSEPQILAILCQTKGGMPVGELRRELSMTQLKLIVYQRVLTTFVLQAYI